MNQNWVGYKQFSNDDNAALVDISVRLSKPCGNGRTYYNHRARKIIDIYLDPTDCDFDNRQGSCVNPLHQQTIFSQTEFEVYSQNYLIEEINYRFPKSMFKVDDLYLNRYNLYNKPFSTYRTACSSKCSVNTIYNTGSYLLNIAGSY
jgi:hypothetical protein